MVVKPGKTRLISQLKKLQRAPPTNFGDFECRKAQESPDAADYRLLPLFLRPQD
jgi:hypothetical protein